MKAQITKKREEMKILIDNGHGSNTAGKRSPDGKHREYLWARQFAERLTNLLKSLGYDAQRIVTEDTDITITERCRRVNAICKTLGAKNVLLVSIHNNAAGNGRQWLTARGFSAHISLNASSRSKALATCIIEEVEAHGIKVRKYSSSKKQPYWTQNLGICRDTNCAAVLTENLFQDNKEDVALLADADFCNKLACAHAEGIIKYIKSL